MAKPWGFTALPEFRQLLSRVACGLTRGP